MQKALRKEKPAAAGKEHHAQNHAQDLRSTLDWLRAQGDLIETDKEVDPDLEVTGLQKHMDGGCPVLFNKVKGKPNHRVVTNLFGDMNVINKMFGWKDDAERVRKLAYALSHPLKPVEIPQSEAPCQEHVIEKPEGREQVRGADPAHDLRARADRRLRHPLRHRRAVRWRLRPRLQPHEFPLGQCRHVPDLARLAHVAGGEQVLQGRTSRCRSPCASACRRPARCWRARASTTPCCRWAATRSASPARCRARRSAWSRRAPSTPWRSPTPSWCSKATSIRATAASRPRSRRTPASRAASISTRNGRATWARPTRRRPSTSPP